MHDRPIVFFLNLNMEFSRSFFNVVGWMRMNAHLQCLQLLMATAAAAAAVVVVHYSLLIFIAFLFKLIIIIIATIAPSAHIPFALHLCIQKNKKQ